MIVIMMIVFEIKLTLLTLFTSAGEVIAGETLVLSLGKWLLVN